MFGIVTDNTPLIIFSVVFLPNKEKIKFRQIYWTLQKQRFNLPKRKTNNS